MKGAGEVPSECLLMGELHLDLVSNFRTVKLISLSSEDLIGLVVIR